MLSSWKIIFLTMLLLPFISANSELYIDDKVTVMESFYFKSIKYKNNTNLQKIVLNNNGLEYIDEDAFAGLPNLKTLDVSKNKLKDLSIRSESLKYLYLEENNISDLPQDFLKNLPNLRKLSLRKNNIVLVKWKLQHPLVHLDLSDNPLKSVNIDSKALEHLDLQKCSKFSMQLNCPNVYTIDLTESEHYTGDDLICKKSQHLVIYSTNKDTESLEVKKCNNELNIDADSSESITDKNNEKSPQKIFSTRFITEDNLIISQKDFKFLVFSLMIVSLCFVFLIAYNVLKCIKSKTDQHISSHSPV